MNGQKAFRYILAASVLAAFTGATQAQAASCSASVAAEISRSSGGTCGAALSVGEEFTITYRIDNNSFVDDAGQPNDGEPVGATIDSGNTLDATLAQETGSVGGTELPTVLEFVPVCPAGSVANEGDECAANADCGGSVCGCVESIPGMTCTANGGNHVTFNFGQSLDFAADEEIQIAIIRVRVTDTVSGSTCGQFFTRIDSDGDLLEVDDPACDSNPSAGAQASAYLHAPECASDEDCGDEECNVCADQGTDPHCEVANIGDPCGTDSDPDDCRTPACVDNEGLGECEQDQSDVPNGTTCDDGEDVECTDDECVDGVCEHTENNDFCDDDNVCTSDLCDATNDCVYEFICEGNDICRSPGYWGTHAGDAKNNSVNVAQEVIDAVGGSITVCGQTISETDDIGSLDSSIEGICVRVKGVRERQLYRQLVAATLNCAVSGGIDDCDTLMAPYFSVSYDECNEVCAGTPDADPPTVNECIAALDCFNNGGHIIDGECGLGTCSDEGDACDEDADCDQSGDPQTCDLFPNNCHDAELCNEELGVCPKSGPAGSAGACKEARANDCTIDDCN
jgi:hypothetical protein